MKYYIRAGPGFIRLERLQKETLYSAYRMI